MTGEPDAHVTVLHTAATTREMVVGRLGELAAGDGVELTSAPGRVDVRVAAWRGGDPARLGRIRDRLGELVYGSGEQTLDGVVHHMLAERGATVASAESLTGGMIGHTLTAASGASATYRGGVIAYATDLKAKLLGVDEALLSTRGAVDPDVALEMAAGAAERLGATVGLAVTGVAGPRPQEGKPVGQVHIAVSGSGLRWGDSADSLVYCPRLTGNRESIRESTVVHALDLLRRYLDGLAPLPDVPE